MSVLIMKENPLSTPAWNLDGTKTLVVFGYLHLVGFRKRLEMIKFGHKNIVAEFWKTPGTKCTWKGSGNVLWRLVGMWTLVSWVIVRGVTSTQTPSWHLCSGKYVSFCIAATSEPCTLCQSLAPHLLLLTRAATTRPSWTNSLRS